MPEAREAGTAAAPPAASGRRRRWRFGEFTPREFSLIAVAVAVSAALAIAAAGHLPFVAVAERWLGDFRLAVFVPGLAEPRQDIVIVTVAEETLAELDHRSPVDRAFIAGVLDQLNAKGARLVGVDYLFDQPTVPGDDNALRRALGALKEPPVVAWADVKDGLTRRQSEYLRDFVQGLNIRPGVVRLDLDDDGAVRRIYPGRADQAGKFVPGFPGAIAEALGKPPPRTAIELAYLTPRRLKGDVFNRYEAQLVEALPAPLFRDKIVLVGADQPEVDRHRTPLAAVLGHEGGELPGVVIHAHALAQILDGRSILRSGPFAVLLLTLAAAALGMTLAVAEMRPWAKAATSMAALAIHGGATGLALYSGGPLVPIVAPTIAFLGSLSAGGVYLARRYRDKRRLIREAFQRYLEPSVVRQLLDDPDALVTEGEEREMTFLFTDMENFSLASEKIPPRLMVKLLAEYFDGICEVLVRRGATIDKYVGDAVVAIFGAPLPQVDHAERAVAAAMEIAQVTEAFRGRAKAEHGAELGRTRVGVNTGVCVVGNFGSRYRHNYTAFGDAINTANRLEGANKALGTQICVGQATAAQCRGFAFLPLGFLRLRGKGEIVEAFTPVAKADAASAWFRDYVDAFGVLRDGGTGAAAEAFARIRGNNPAAAPAAVHAKRLKAGAQDAVVAA